MPGGGLRIPFLPPRSPPKKEGAGQCRPQREPPPPFAAHSRVSASPNGDVVSMLQRCHLYANVCIMISREAFEISTTYNCDAGSSCRCSITCEGVGGAVCIICLQTGCATHCWCGPVPDPFPVLCSTFGNHKVSVDFYGTKKDIIAALAAATGGSFSSDSETVITVQESDVLLFTLLSSLGIQL